MMQHNRKWSIGSDNVVNFDRSSAPDSGTAALNLVYQAAEVFNGIEARARETEAQAQSLCKNALERLKLAETRIDAAERARREIIAEADYKLHEASKVLKEAERRVRDAEDKATAAEHRAQVAEAQAHEAKRALALVEDAIRRRLLNANPQAAGNFHAVA